MVPSVSLGNFAILHNFVNFDSILNNFKVFTVSSGNFIDLEALLSTFVALDSIQLHLISRFLLQY